MTLHTVGPADMAEDERRIGKGYQKWMGGALFALPLVVAQLVDTKWVIAAGFAAALLLMHEVGGRLHDICIRLRRTNILLFQQK
jgi:hypothetical protein